MTFNDLILRVPLFLMAISFHEYAHAWAAVRRGDPTPQLEGRLTLNFTKHLSALGTIMLVLVGLGWAKPVNVNTRNLRNPKVDMFWIALAGPVANLVLAAGFSLLYHAFLPVLPFNSLGETIWRFLYLGVQLNVILFFFNLLPIPPLDGSKILSRFLSPRWNYSLLRIEQYGFLILFLLLQFFNLHLVLGRATFTVVRLFGLPG